MTVLVAEPIQGVTFGRQVEFGGGCSLDSTFTFGENYNATELLLNPPTEVDKRFGLQTGNYTRELKPNMLLLLNHY